ncbi:hypothetical protein XU18_0041 [Perkinsela sp. CCAP 1560/4]|nr:hypothetical protein XU18_0041 [Perkinsela sp. CCAP 1560/4]|eukprot:KNH09356.1 hypothetical protein XU18_0041 [Perkinsela sp. CCAP 1560/4]
MDATVIPETQIEVTPPLPSGFSGVQETQYPVQSAISTPQNEAGDEEISNLIQNQGNDDCLLGDMPKNIGEPDPESTNSAEKDSTTDSQKSTGETAKGENSCSSFLQLHRAPILNERVRIKYNKRYYSARITSHNPGDITATVQYEATAAGTNTHSAQTACIPLNAIYPHEPKLEETDGNVESKVSGKKPKTRHSFEATNEFFTVDKPPVKDTHVEAMPIRSKKYFAAQVTGFAAGGAIVQYAGGSTEYLPFSRLRPLPEKPEVVSVKAEAENMSTTATNDNTVDKTSCVRNAKEVARDSARIGSKKRPSDDGEPTKKVKKSGGSKHSSDMFSMHGLVRGAYYYFRSSSVASDGMHRIGQLHDLVDRPCGEASKTKLVAELLLLETGSQYISHGQFLLPCARRIQCSTKIHVPLTFLRKEHKLIFIKETDLAKAFVLLDD